MHFGRSFRTAAVSIVAAMISSSAFAGQITGTVKLDGKPPEMQPIDMSSKPECANQHADPVLEETVVANDQGMLKNAVVYLKSDNGSDLPGGGVPKSAAILDQKGCVYVPHVVAMMAGQTLVVKNDDNCAHNIHSMAEKNEVFNFIEPTKGNEKAAPTQKEPEFYQVKCDIHPWMSAWVAVLDNPYFAITDDAGRFKINTGKLPDGTYTLVAWQEKYKSVEQKITLKNGSASDVRIEYEPNAKTSQSPAKGEPRG